MAVCDQQDLLLVGEMIQVVAEEEHEGMEIWSRLGS